MCDICIYREGMHEGLSFVERDGRFLCSECDEIARNPIDPVALRDEFNAALETANTDDYDAILAFSGGRDSTVALKLLVERGLRVLAFTVDQGMKNAETMNNIHAIIEHFKVDWLLLHAFPREAFRRMLVEGRTVCGRACRDAWKLPAFEKVARRYGVATILTGGDTPKRRSCVTGGSPAVIRVLAAFSYNKADLERAIAQLPWKDPGVGPYDTDCLMASYGLENAARKNSGRAPNVLIDYLAERIRFSILDRKEELERLARIPLLSREGRDQLERFVGIE